MFTIKKVSNGEAEKIIESRELLGIFYTIEKRQDGKNIYVGIDNCHGEAWTEDFKNLSSCKRWLSQ